MSQERISKEEGRLQWPTKYQGPIGRVRYGIDYACRVSQLIIHAVRTGETELPPKRIK